MALWVACLESCCSQTVSGKMRNPEGFWLLSKVNRQNDFEHLKGKAQPYRKLFPSYIGFSYFKNLR
jgi:hypothetical protein